MRVADEEVAAVASETESGEIVNVEENRSDVAIAVVDEEPPLNQSQQAHAQFVEQATREELEITRAARVSCNSSTRDKKHLEHFRSGVFQEFGDCDSIFCNAAL